MNTHHCDFCNRDVEADFDEQTYVARCPRCGVTDMDYQFEFGIDEPWLRSLQEHPSEPEQGPKTTFGAP